MLSLSGSRNDKTNYREELNNVRLKQSSVFATFNARRNAGRIERYFVQVRSKRNARVIVLLSASIFFVALFLMIFYERKFIIASFGDVTYNTMISIQESLSISLKGSLFETYLFVNIFKDLFVNPVVIPFNAEGAPNLTSILIEAHLASSGNIIWWDFGLPNGGLISIESYIPDSAQVTLIFTNVSNGNGTMFTWISDKNGKNSSYPLTNGDNQGEYDSTERPWYQQAITLNKTIWTELYFGRTIGNDYVPLVSCASPAYNILEERYEFINALGMQLEQTQSLIQRAFTTPNSRTALTTQSGTIIAVTGNEGPIDIYNGKIIVKTIPQLSDPIWRAITKDPQFKDINNFSGTYLINDKQMNLHVMTVQIEVSPGIIWILYSVICLDDLIGYQSIYDINSIVLSLAIVLCTLILSLLLYYFIQKLIDKKQSKILSSKKEGSESNLKQIGILPALSSLKRLLRSHADNPEVINEVTNVINNLQHIENNLFYNAGALYDSIEDDAVRNKFISMFGKLDEELLKEPILHIPEFSQNRSSRTETTPSQSSNNISPEIYEAFNQRVPITSLNLDVLPSQIVSIVSQYNFKDPLFDCEKFDQLMTEAVESIMPEMLSLCFDSVDFNHMFLRWKIQSILYDSDLSLILMVMTIVWHITMRNRRSQPDLIERYFILDNSELRNNSQTLLITLYDTLTDDTPRTMQRWVNFTGIVNELIEYSVVPKHQCVFAKCTLFSKTVDMTLSSNNSLDLIELLLIGMMISFAFHDTESVRKAREFINEDFSDREQDILKFVTCLQTHHIKPVITILRNICGNGFMRRFGSLEI